MPRMAVVEEDKCDLGEAIQMLYAGDPFFEFFLRIKIIVSFPGFGMLPPFLRVSPVESHIRYARGHLNYGRHKPLKSGLINYAKSKALRSQDGEYVAPEPAYIPEFYDQREVRKKIGEPTNIIDIFGGILKSPGKLKKYASELICLNDRRYSIQELKESILRFLLVDLMCHAFMGLYAEEESLGRLSVKRGHGSSRGHGIVAKVKFHSREMSRIVV